MVTGTREVVADTPAHPIPEQPKEGEETSSPRMDQGVGAAEAPLLTLEENLEDQQSSQLDWEPEAVEGWKEVPPTVAGRKRKERENLDPRTENTEKEDSKVRRVEPMSPPPTTLEEGEMEGTPPPSSQVADSSSYSRDEEPAQAGTPDTPRRYPLKRPPRPKSPPGNPRRSNRRRRIWGGLK
ncbi:uncharacterized protein LOC112589318 [Harpegnathos saltator]|uniref:uncharacterized protein LOC112589318 n=1 Tax=Harpegnathos saltator TaxID=610380 RepID=UPI000DBEDDF6|nr:uncharacterized protein LOC112589318 [Harpegnathos saltator]